MRRGMLAMLVLLAGVGLLVKSQMPEIRRYVNIERM